LFAHLLHISPAGVDELTVDDFETLIDWMDRHQAQQKEAASHG